MVLYGFALGNSNGNGDTHILVKFIKRLFNKSKPDLPVIKAVTLPRSEHTISREQISEYALKVLYRLDKAGFRACLVGGAVRDLLLGREPKDFDVATDAHPEEVNQLFRNCRLIGRRFRLAHIHFGREIIEVATFRAGSGDDLSPQSEVQTTDTGRLLRDNQYGDIEQDALRRDFTVNGLYYDIRDFSVHDYSKGIQDIEKGIIRLIGDPRQRFAEDPVRMLRAIRFMGKLGFRLSEDIETLVPEMAHKLSEIPAARLFDEVLKLFHSGYAVETFELLRHYGLFSYLFPLTEEALATEADGYPKTFILNALINTDKRISQSLPVTPAFLYAVLLWEPLQVKMDDLLEAGDDSPSDYHRWQKAASFVIQQQVSQTSLPRRFSTITRDIWSLQRRMQRINGKQPERTFSHPAFRAAYDFLCLRASIDDELLPLAEWWTEYQKDKPAAKDTVAPKRKRSRPRRRHKPSQHD